MVAVPQGIAFSAIQKSMIRYFQRTVGVRLSLEEWPLSIRLPVMLTSNFRLLKSRLEGREVLFVLSRFEIEGFEIRKHARKVQNIFDGVIIYVLAGGTTRLRNSLIAMKVPFVIPGYQMYLPCFFIDLREAAIKRGEVYLERSTSLSPAAQVLAIKLMDSGSDEALTTAMICTWTGFSKMTVSKAMRELAKFSCVNIGSAGRSNAISLVGRRIDAWLQFVDRLKNPVLSVYFMQTPLEDCAKCFVAGEQALAALSMLGKPALETYACSKSAWALLSDRNVWSESSAEFENNYLEYCRVEVWAYDPALLLDQGMVDIVSLYLSMRLDSDERIQSELESILKVKQLYAQ